MCSRQMPPRSNEVGLCAGMCPEPVADQWLIMCPEPVADQLVPEAVSGTEDGLGHLPHCRGWLLVYTVLGALVLWASSMATGTSRLSERLRSGGGRKAGGRSELLIDSKGHQSAGELIMKPS